MSTPLILVIDDDVSARLVMRAALRKAGYAVQLAEGGADGLRQFRALRPDMVMLDVDMPDLDGHAVCAALRAEAGPLLPIVMVTGMDDVKSVETAYEHGATDFVAKPVHWGLIGHRVRYLFRAQQSMRELRAAEARNTAVLEAIPDLLFELDAHGRYTDYRVPSNQLPARPASDFIGRSVAEMLPPRAAAACMAALRAAHDLGHSRGQQFELRQGDASAWYELSVARKAMAAGETPRYIVLSRDITERKEAEARIARMAYFDSLTGLPNRRAFIDRVDAEVARAAGSGQKMAVLFMDLDGFKNINDTMGHAAGDLLLQWTAERLREGLRPSDLLSRPVGLDGPEAGEDDDVELARLGGDEFTALLSDVGSRDDALAIARRIGAIMRRPFTLEGREITLTASIGIALFPDDGGDGATLLKHADTAMYQAKGSGRDNAQLYAAAYTQRIVKRLELDAALRGAIERDEFHLLYQPQVDAASGRIDAVEALIRWRHPTRGVVSPLEFIPVAEDNGLIDRIGQWVLETACADAARWSRAGLDVGMAVNLSPLQITTPGLVQRVKDTLAACGLEPARLELEVTESALLGNWSATCATLQELRDHGVRIALDDFGTGYSSLAYLTRLPVGNIKVDRCFVGGLLEGGESEAIVRAVLGMASSLRMRVTAEGVETLPQALALRRMACDSLQGYYFSKPVPAADIPALLARRWLLVEGAETGT